MNISFFIVLIIILLVIFLCLFDLLQLHIAREETKNAADACVLSAAQNLLYFNERNIMADAKKICSENNCEIDYLNFNYEKVIASAKKKVTYIFLKNIIKKNIVYSRSETEIIFPWDDRFKICQKFKFGH